MLTACCPPLYTATEIASTSVIPAKAGIHQNPGFPRIKYGAGLVKPGMTNQDNAYVVMYNPRDPALGVRRHFRRSVFPPHRARNSSSSIRRAKASSGWAPESSRPLMGKTGDATCSASLLVLFSFRVPGHFVGS